MKKPLEPYRLLFPIGLIFAILGVLVWVRFSLSSESAYPAAIHARLMIGAFLLAFVMGFLMTAIPKMTASFPAGRFDIWSAVILTIATGISAYGSESSTFYILAASSILYLMSFGMRRARRRTGNVPPFFIFVAAGLICGFFGSFLLAFAEVGGHDSLLALGRKLFFQGMILCLALGIGSRLIPVLTGNSPKAVRWWVYPASALTLILSLGFESYGYPIFGGFLKAGISTFVAIALWGVFRRAKNLSHIAYGMKIAAVMVLLGLWFSVLQPGFSVHWMHLTYVGGFGLMTLTVASRVTLAHGHYDLSLESRSKVLPLVGGLVLLAAITRVFAPFIPALYVSHLAYAAITWMAAVVIWSIAFVIKMIWFGRESEGC